MFNWVKGRQNTGYEKLKIFQFLNMDCYILRYKVGDYIPWHTDPVPGKRHYRLNFELKQAEIGGTCLYMPWANSDDELNYQRRKACFILSDNRRFVLFRSDIIPHKVTKIEKGTRIVLTFGIALWMKNYTILHLDMGSVF
jgi:hypothetical protein